MVGKILIIIFLTFFYIVLTCGLCDTVIGRNNPIHKFKIQKAEYYDESDSIIINSIDDKFFFFLLCLIWPLLVLFYWIPIGIYKVFKFLIEFIGWCIVKLFKL